MTTDQTEDPAAAETLSDQSAYAIARRDMLNAGVLAGSVTYVAARVEHTAGHAALARAAVLATDLENVLREAVAFYRTTP